MRSFAIKSSLAMFCLFLQVEALAYTLKCNDANTSCKVFCDNKNLAGEMFWNGSKRSDGVEQTGQLTPICLKLKQLFKVVWPYFSLTLMLFAIVPITTV